MKQSSTNEQKIMNYLQTLHKNPEINGRTNGNNVYVGRTGLDSVDQDQRIPDRSVIKSIMNYARALDTFKTQSGKTIFVLGN